MTQHFIIKLGDEVPNLRVGVAACDDHTGTTVVLRYRRRATEHKPGGEIITRDAVFEPPAGVRYDWQGENREVGTYDAEWIFTQADGTTFTQPFIFSVVEPRSSEEPAAPTRRGYEWL